MLKDHFEAQACNPAICIAGFFSEMNSSGYMLIFDRDLPMIFLKSILKKRVLGIKEKKYQINPQILWKNKKIL